MYKMLLTTDSNKKRAKAIAEAVVELPPDSEDVSVVVLNVFKKFHAADDGGQVGSDELYQESTFPESVSVAQDVLEERGVSVS